MSPTNDEQLYLEATQEVDNGTQAPALWAKAMALAEGGQKKARYRYSELKVDNFSSASASVPPPRPIPGIDDSDDVLHPTPDNLASQTPHPPSQGTGVGQTDNMPSVEPLASPPPKTTPSTPSHCRIPM